MQKKSDDFSIQDAVRLAKSNTGQQLFAHLQAQNSDTMRTAMDQAAAGNYDQVKKTLAALLADPQTRALLEQLGGTGNG